ncbi:PulJ/GspJ family protein [Hyphobacterium sp.]|uniref:PulJ/GspJ family protein n=1 Tax=Hyphobacterium sp. TaxID=2004662 RepID=UPI003B52D729
MKSTSRGFTLVETVIAMALASVGLASVYQVYASAADSERAANEAAAAVRLAETLRPAAQGGEGETAGFNWTVTTRPSPDYEGLETVHIRLTAGSGRNYEIRFDRPAVQGGGE